jgi:uncharacterized protein (TIGR02284 family)
MYVNDDPGATILADLVETLEDGREGFRQAAVKLADDGHPDLARAMSRFSEERARLSAELREAALARGVEIEADRGSSLGAVHRGWMALKDSLSGSDPHAVLAVAESGEDHAVDEYDRALSRPDLPEDLRPVIVDQAQRVRSAHDEVRDLRDQSG